MDASTIYQATVKKIVSDGIPGILVEFDGGKEGFISMSSLKKPKKGLGRFKLGAQVNVSIIKKDQNYHDLCVV